ncbi:MAG: hypothetical protein AB4372_21560 [Xenococcus sp. (in: cyanobacteria)]
MTRSQRYAWAGCMVAPKKYGYYIRGEIGKQLCDRYQELRRTNKGKDCLMRIVFKATRMLFYELLNELTGEHRSPQAPSFYGGVTVT